MTRNMRLQIGNTDQSNNPEEIAEFSNWILKVGDRTLGDSSDGFVEIEIPEENLILEVGNPVAGIFDSNYPFVASNFRSEKYYENRAIHGPTLKDVECINEHLHSLIPREMKEYLSSYSVCSS
ncbi:hypothetical protein ACS0TY_032752 [Phlomoides rotata]